jgi:hypothetical protein
MPTDAELDIDLASYPNDSSVDQPGTRFTKTKFRAVVWETTESIHLKAGDTLVFSPNWFHRIPPQSKDATHSGVTFTAKHQPTHKYEGAITLNPKGLDSFDTAKAACYKLIDLYRELTNPNLNLQQGLPRFPCHASRLHNFTEHEFGDHKDDFVKNATLHHEDEL